METSHPVALECLRVLVAKTDALAHAVAELFDDVVGLDAVDDRRSLERLAYLVGATADAATDAVDACGRLTAEGSRAARQ
jgi:hypothetical protein